MKQFSFLFLFINSLIFAQANVAYDASFGTNGRLLTTSPADNSVPIYYSTKYKTIQNIDNKLISVSGAGSISRYNLDGTLDATFGLGGTRIVTSTSGYEIYDLANLSDGSIMVLYSSDIHSYIRKYTKDGALDTTFGISGVLELLVTNYQNGFRQIKVLADDYIIISGEANTSSTSLGVIGIIKLDKNGNYDTSFSLDGKITLTSSIYSYYSLVGIDIDSTNNIYVGFQSRQSGSSSIYGNVQKLSPTGSIVTSFGTNGIATQFVPNGNCNDMKIFPNGKIIIAAASLINGSNDLYLIVFNPAGKLDTSNGSGIFQYDIDNKSSDNIQKILIVDNNTFYLTGYIVTGGANYGLLLKLNSNFALDTSFNYSGIFTTYYFLNKNSANYELTLQKDKKLLLSGSSLGSGNNSGTYIGLIRLIDTKLLATNESKKVNNVSIYPNPASDVINLQADKSLIGKAYEIVDMTGKSIMRNKVSDKEINVSSLTTGNYILKIDSESYKFIKK